MSVTKRCKKFKCLQDYSLIEDSRLYIVAKKNMDSSKDKKYNKDNDNLLQSDQKLDGSQIYHYQNLKIIPSP